MEEDNQAISHKGEKVRNFILPIELTAISFAEEHGNRAAKKINVGRKRIREWRAKNDSIEKNVKKVKGSQRKRCDGGGRKPFSEKLDEAVFEWFQEHRSKGLRVSRKLIMKKAKYLYEEMVRDSQSEGDESLAGTGWLRNFMKWFVLEPKNVNNTERPGPAHC